MLPPDLQRLQHMEEYCQAIQKTMDRRIIWETACQDIPALLAFCRQWLSR